MDSKTFIGWVEKKLIEHGVNEKFVPDAASLKAAWQRAWRINALNEAIEEVAKNIPDPPDPPDDLAAIIATRLQENPTLAWDMVLMEVQS